MLPENFLFVLQKYKNNFILALGSSSIMHKHLTDSQLL